MQRDYNESQRELKALFEQAKELYQSVNVDKQKELITELEQETMQDNFWQDKERFTKVNKQLSHLKKKVGPWQDLMSELTDSQELFEMALSENDEDVLEDIASKLPEYHERFNQLETLELLGGESDTNNAFITIHPGAGGTESQDWASMLFRMYTRWSEKRGFSFQVIDFTPGEEAGIKSATILVKGDYSFGYLKGEQGVHRLVRISPFDSNKRRHTSFASVEVMPEIADDIEIDINESDLKIDTYRASGAGGQHVNTTDSAVRITHIPTKIVVQCQNERSQHKNKNSAMKVLKSKLYEHQQQQLEEKRNANAAEKKKIEWGSQIRSYVFQPYTMVKDHRTNEETGSVDYVFDGDLDRFIYAYLKFQRKDKG